jgi:hypothetical protein
MIPHALFVERHRQLATHVRIEKNERGPALSPPFFRPLHQERAETLPPVGAPDNEGGDEKANLTNLVDELTVGIRHRSLNHRPEKPDRGPVEVSDENPCVVRLCLECPFLPPLG